MKLLFGHGYLGSRVAALWLAAGDPVTVVTRSETKANQLREAGCAAIVANISEPATLRDLPSAETILFSVGFDRKSDSSIEEVYADGVRNVLAALPPKAGRFIYISSTGVYGPAGGDWVDEDTPPNPQRAGGTASLAAEREIQNHQLGRNSVILRLAGIYGPDRVPFIKQLRSGEPIAAPRAGHLNLIHVDDAADVVRAAESWSNPCEQAGVFCVSDGHPVIREEFYREVARLTGAPEPSFVAPDPDSPRALRANSDKRISNGRMLSELRVYLSLANYREGLTQILDLR